ncbi:MAG TPA: glycosyltransferase family 4 protein [Polyangia bacterium]
MRSLRIGIVAESYFPNLGGIQEHVLHLRNFLRRQGVEVTILTGRPAQSTSLPGPQDAEHDVIRVGRSRSFRSGGTFTQATLGPLAAWNFHRALRRGHFDLLNIHGPCDFGLAFFGLSMFRGPKVLTLHSCFPDAPWRHRVAPYYRWVLGRAAAVIAVSQATAQSMQRYAEFTPSIIPNGIDVPYWRANPSPRYLRPGRRNLVYLGRLESRNGPDLAIDAFSKVAALLPDVRLLVAGEGPMRASLQARVPPHLRARVEFLGAIYDERPELLASSSVFLLPARAVGFSIMVLEAFAAGLPVVALPALGTDRAGEHWSNVVLAKDNSAEAFADAVVETLQRQETTDRIARGRALAETFDWARVGHGILDVFEGVVQPRAQLLGVRPDAAA